MAKKVVKREEEPEVLSVEELSKYIKQLAATTKKLLNKGHLNRRAIVLLIYDSIPTRRTTGRGYGQKLCNKKQIEAVLDAITDLKDTYCEGG